jgi:hypothetical protein
MFVLIVEFGSVEVFDVLKLDLSIFTEVLVDVFLVSFQSVSVGFEGFDFGEISSVAFFGDGFLQDFSRVLVVFVFM